MLNYSVNGTTAWFAGTVWAIDYQKNENKSGSLVKEKTELIIFSVFVSGKSSKLKCIIFIQRALSIQDRN